MNFVYAIEVDCEDGISCEPPFYHKREDAVKALNELASDYIKTEEDDGGQVFVTTVDRADDYWINIRFLKLGDVIISYQLVVCEVI